MGYEVALQKAWEDLCKLNLDKNFSVKLLGDQYTVDCREKKALSLACNVAAKDFTAILILHYLISSLKGLPVLTEEWLDFKELSGIEGYYSAFRNRAIQPIIRKYGKHPDGLLTVLDRLPGKRVDQGDVGVVLEAFEGAPVLVTLWRGDEEFGPDANMLFDKSITRIFCTEDVVVLAGFVAAQL